MPKALSLSPIFFFSNFQILFNLSLQPAIRMTMSNKSNFVVCVISCTKIFEVVVVKLLAIVVNHYPGYTESTYYILQHKTLHLIHRDYGQWFCFHPFSKIINGD